MGELVSREKKQIPHPQTTRVRDDRRGSVQTKSIGRLVACVKAEALPPHSKVGVGHPFLRQGKPEGGRYARRIDGGCGVTLYSRITL